MPILLAKIEVTLKRFIYVIGERVTLVAIAQKSDDFIYILLRTMSVVENRMCTHIGKISLRKCDTKLPIPRTVNTGVPDRYISEANHIRNDGSTKIEPYEWIGSKF